MPGIALVQMFESEWRSRTVAKQAFEPRPVGALDAYRTIHREAAVVRPGAHFGGVIFVDQPPFDEGAQDTGSGKGRQRGRGKGAGVELNSHNP